jgi:hypothetical protein
VRYKVSGVRCQQSDDGEQKTEDSKGASSSSFYHVSSVVWPLSSETRTLTPETLHSSRGIKIG